MCTHWELVHEETIEGFDIKLYITPEDTEIDWDITEEERKEIIEKIGNGLLIYFIARITASKNDIELAYDCLGGLCCKSVEEFINESGYYDDMKNTVITEARQTIAKLCKGVNHD